MSDRDALIAALASADPDETVTLALLEAFTDAVLAKYSLTYRGSLQNYGDVESGACLDRHLNHPALLCTAYTDHSGDHIAYADDGQWHSWREAGPTAGWPGARRGRRGSELTQDDHRKIRDGQGME
jgi:hypothetical protein